MATHALTPAASAYRGGLYEWLTTTDHKKIGIMYVDQLVPVLPDRRASSRCGVRTELAAPGHPVLHERARLQRALLDPRDGDDLPVHHPDAGGPRELRGAAA